MRSGFQNMTVRNLHDSNKLVVNTHPLDIILTELNLRIKLNLLCDKNLVHTLFHLNVTMLLRVNNACATQKDLSDTCFDILLRNHLKTGDLQKVDMQLQFQGQLVTIVSITDKVHC